MHCLRDVRRHPDMHCHLDIIVIPERSEGRAFRRTISTFLDQPHRDTTHCPAISVDISGYNES